MSEWFAGIDLGGTSIGVGVPGLVDLASGATKFLPNLPAPWRDVSVKSQLVLRSRDTSSAPYSTNRPFRKGALHDVTDFRSS
jgi:hypothetical protein